MYIIIKYIIDLEDLEACEKGAEGAREAMRPLLDPPIHPNAHVHATRGPCRTDFIRRVLQRRRALRQAGP